MDQQSNAGSKRRPTVKINKRANKPSNAATAVEMPARTPVLGAKSAAMTQQTLTTSNAAVAMAKLGRGAMMRGTTVGTMPAATVAVASITSRGEGRRTYAALLAKLRTLANSATGLRQRRGISTEQVIPDAGLVLRDAW